MKAYLLFTFSIWQKSKEAGKAVVLSVLTWFAFVGHASAQYISDGTFDPANYAVVSAYGSGSFSQVTTGGNPGDYLSVNFSGQNIAAAVIDKAISYNPSTQGAILSLNLKADFEGVSFGGARFFAEQNGVLYIDIYSNTNASSWTTYSVSPTASQFYYANGSGPGALNFTSSGAPIYFGFGTSVGSSSPGQQGFAVDNFQVSILSAPEPSNKAMLLGGLGLLALWRLRSRRA